VPRGTRRRVKAPQTANGNLQFRPTINLNKLLFHEELRVIAHHYYEGGIKELKNIYVSELYGYYSTLTGSHMLAACGTETYRLYGVDMSINKVNQMRQSHGYYKRQ